jgi:hypothetical protein
MPGHARFQHFTFSVRSEINLFSLKFDGKRIVASLALLLLLFIMQAGAARANVALDSFSSGAQSCCSSSSGGVNAGSVHTVGNGSNRLLIAGISIISAAGTTPPASSGATWTVNSVTQNMTYVGSNVAGNTRVDLFALVNPNSGANGSVFISFNGSYVGYKMGSVSYTGVDQTAPLGGLVSGACANITSSQSCSINVPTSVGSVIFAMLTANTTSGFTVAATDFFWGPQTNGCTNCNSGGNSAFTFQGADYSSTGTSRTITASTSNGAATATNNFALGAFSINPASASAPTGTGTNSQTKVGNATVTFSNVSGAGTTTVTAIDPNASAPSPSGYSFCTDCPAYDISTTAAYSPPVAVCISAPNVSNPAALKLLHFETGSWVDRTTSVNLSTKTVCGDVSTLSPFAVALGPTPTAADTSISGTVTTADGQPLGGAIVSLSGSQSSRTITDAAGHYQFDNLQSSGFYTVSPSLANYHFGPRERSFSLNADKTDAIFTATPDTAATANPLDTDFFFVRQQYLDFLGREPDRDGLLYWASEINKCGTDADCLNQRRIGVSAAFLVESEFQQTGSFVYRLYKGALGRQVSYQEFSTDRQQVVGGVNLDAAKAAFADAFVKRAEFAQKYAGATTADAFVDALVQNARQTSGVDLSAQRGALVARYKSGSSLDESRSLALRGAIEDGSFKSAEYNKAFVLMQYFGYLKRDPESAGYDFWLNVLNNKEPNNYLGMVCSFITSAEYQQRFAAVMSHSNRECR